MTKPRVMILRTAGTNCDVETARAFASCGAETHRVHINQLINGKSKLADFHIMAVPGGFTYGDDIESGRILANELSLKLKDQLQEFINQKKLVIGICNGFQVLVRAGILPSTDGEFRQSATLINNDSGKFEARWVHLKTEGKSVWTSNLPETVEFPVAHAEGKFVVHDDVLKTLKDNHQVAFRYIAPDGGNPDYPENPNGSHEHIAGITDPTGRVLGLMPHPERHFLSVHHPSWTRRKQTSQFGDGAVIFQNGVEYVKKNL